MNFNTGDIVAGKYRVDKLLGAGGMGMVVSAHHLQLDEPVAIKFLLPEALQNAEAVGRFTREARAATKIKSEHVVRVIDISNFESGEPYIVMEYLDGQDLGQVVAQRGPLPPDEAAEYVLQACEAIAEAHALGIVHRDLKPANLFLSKRMDGTPLVKVLDFGISKVAGGVALTTDHSLTKTSGMMGSPLYMSPEQMASARDVDARTDIWALGVIVYELLVGRPPFDAESITQLCAMVLQQEAERPRARRPELPAAVDEIVARCLRKSPAERYATVGELAVALAELAPKHARASVKRITGVLRSAGLGTATALPPSSDEMPPNASIQRGASTAVSWGETAPAVPKRSLLPLLAGAGILALIGLGGLLYVLRGGSSVSEQAASAASAVAESAASAGAAPLATLEPSIAPPPEPSASSSAPAPAVSVSALGTCVVASVQLVQIEPRDGGAARGYAGKDHRHSKLRRPAHGFFTGSWRSGLRRLPRDPSARVRHGTTR